MAKIIFTVKGDTICDEFEKEFETTAQYISIVDEQKERYEGLAEVDGSITLYASLVKDGAVLFSGRLV